MRWLGGTVKFAFLGLLVVFALGPFYWMLVTSLTGAANPLATGNSWWPEGVTMAHYSAALRSTAFRAWVANTVLVTAATVAISLACSLSAGYALALLRVPHSRSLVLAFFATYLLPQGVLFIPLLRTLSAMHLTGSPLALVVTFPGLVIPFGTWVIWSFVRGLPPELFEQARLEGASAVNLAVRVLLPLAWPALAAVSVFAVAVVFNDFLYSFTFISKLQSQTLIGALATTDTDMDDPGFVFAAMLLGTAPVAVLCSFFAGSYARGLGTGLVEA